MATAVLSTDLSLPNKRSGKVRDLYDVQLASGEDAILIIATDRISAFDVVMGNGLPGKGVVLTQISKFWFDHFASAVPHHLISTDVNDVPGLTSAEREQLQGRIMLCRRTEVVPIECIARGYITGSGWKDYQRSGSVCGIALPDGLRNSDRLQEPLFTEDAILWSLVWVIFTGTVLGLIGVRLATQHGTERRYQQYNAFREKF